MQDFQCFIWDILFQLTDSLVAHGLTCSMACGILVPTSGMETMVPRIARQRLNHWASRESPLSVHCCIPKHPEQPLEYVDFVNIYHIKK